MTATVAQLRGRLATAVAELSRAGWQITIHHPSEEES